MTRRRDDDHYGAPKQPDPSLQFTGLPLLDPEPEPERARLEREHTIDARFKRFHWDNPKVLEELERRVRAEVDEGARQCSVRTLIAVMRSDLRISINDQYSSRYARLMIERNPQWRDMFDLRELRSA